MRKAVRTAIAVLVCFALLFSSSLSKGVEIGTDVSIVVERLIKSKTEDCTLKEGATQVLTVNVSSPVQTYLWEVSVDGGTSWAEVGTSSSYTITHARPNTPTNVPYQYRVTVTTSTGTTDSAIIRVLVSDDYDYRTIALRNGDTDVSAYMHDETRLVVTPLPKSDSAARELVNKLADDCLPLVLYDVRLVNQNNEVVPYLGTVEVKFHVGSRYDGMTLRAFHFHDNTVTEYSGVVSGGDLTIFVTGLSPFMVEVPESVTHTVIASADAGGNIVPAGDVNVADGADKTFTFLPDAGYEVSAVKVGGAPVVFTGNSYTISGITENKTISVSFRAVTPSSTLHTVTINEPAHGSVYPSGTIQVRHGEAQAVYFYPASGYELDTVIVNGVTVNVIGNSYTLSAVTGNVAVTVSFRSGSTQPPNVYKTISASAGANGSISPMGDVSVEYNGGAYFYIIPTDGYETDEVRVDGSPVTTGDAYHFSNVTADHTIHATFKLRPTYYTITANAGANGSISPNTMQVQEGRDQTFSFLPNSGYEVDTVTVDGTALASTGSSYTFANVTETHTISVTFKPGTTPPITYHEITVNAPTVGGTISPSETIEVPAGGSQTINFIPNAGYVLDTVTIDGVLQTSPRSSYTFTNVTGAHTVSATFRSIVQQHTITAGVSGAGGRISPAGSVLVLPGGAQTFYFIPDSGYTVREVRVDGIVQSSAAYQYTFADVREDHTLLVTFARTATPPTGDTDNKLLWTLLIIALLLLAVFCLLYLRRLKKPEEPGTATVTEPQKDEQG